MDNPQQEDMEETAEIFKCLGDKTRVEVLLTMEETERCVHEISEMTEQEISNVSHHLRRLKEKRLVDYRKEGRHKYY
ncbi:MAG: ArsR/SmtB family transcription factor, partial [Candidatus Natronoplasma sp.]